MDREEGWSIALSLVASAAYEAQERAAKEARKKAMQKGLTETKLAAKWWRGAYLMEALTKPSHGPVGVPRPSTYQVYRFLEAIRNDEVTGWKYGPGHRGGSSGERDTAYWHEDFQDDLLKVRPTSLDEYEEHRAELRRSHGGDRVPLEAPTSFAALRMELLAEARRAREARPEVPPYDEEWNSAPEAEAETSAVFWFLQDALENQWRDEYPELPERLRDFIYRYVRTHLSRDDRHEETAAEVFEKVRRRELHFIPARAKFGWIIRVAEWLRLQQDK